MDNGLLDLIICLDTELHTNIYQKAGCDLNRLWSASGMVLVFMQAHCKIIKYAICGQCQQWLMLVCDIMSQPEKVVIFHIQ